MFVDDVHAVERLCAQPPDVAVAIPETDRIIAADIDGDPDGTTVVLIHGTPDSRLARHPDASIVRSLGIELICVDRPGFGHSTVDSSATPATFGRDLAALLYHLGRDRVHLLAWSAGAIWALGAATVLGERVEAVHVVGGLVPIEAFDDAEVRAAAGDARLGMIDMATELGPVIASEMIAPLLVPDPMTPSAALEHRLETGPNDLDKVAGAAIQMAAACCDAVRQGTAGLVRDFTIQFGFDEVDLGRVTQRVRLFTGSGDETCPPEFARWFAQRLTNGSVEIVEDAGHGLLITHWAQIMTAIIERPVRTHHGA